MSKRRLLDNYTVTGNDFLSFEKEQHFRMSLTPGNIYLYESDDNLKRNVFFE